MPHRHRFLLLSFLAAGFLAGCSTAPEVSVNSYQPPAPGAQAASLIGSRISEGGLFGSDYTGFVNMIDQRMVDRAGSRWNEPIGLAPGRHTISAEYHYSNFVGRAELSLDARAGVNYRLMAKKSDLTSTDGRVYGDFWIIDLSTGRAVTLVNQQQLSGGKKSTIFYPIN